MSAEETRCEPLTPHEQAELNAVRDAVRDPGAVLAADPTGTKVRLWVHGVTAHEGAIVQRPEGLPKWMSVAGATFEAWGVDSVEALSVGVFTKHANDDEAPYPTNIAEEAERLRTCLRAEDWQRYQDSLEAAPEYRQPDWVKDLLGEMRTKRPAKRSPRPKTGRVLKPKGAAGEVVPPASASSQHAEHTSGGWLCHYPIRRPNGTLLKLCENPVSAEGVLCHQHHS